MVPRLAATGLILTSLLLACGSSPEPSDSTAPAPGRAASSAQPATTPTLAAEFHSLGLQRSGGRLFFTGILTNQSISAIEGIRLSVEASRPSPDVPRDTALLPLLPWLPAGGSTPFQWEIQDYQNASEWVARVQSYELSDLDLAPTSVDITAHETGGDGRIRVLGWVTVESPGQAILDGLVFTAMQRGSILASDHTVVATHLRQGVPMPFEGTFPDGIDPESIDSYALAHGVAITPFSGLELSGAIQLQFDEQSNPFLIGVLFNSGPSELSPHLLFPIEIEGRLVRVFELESAIPLSPGELRPFGLRLRDLPLEPGEQDVDIDPIVEAQAHDSRGKLTLALDIDTLETTGSSVFFKGSVANDSGQLAQAPSVFAAMRNLEGELLTAAWLALTHPLASGEDEQFVLEVPLPAGAEIAEGEWDLIALGMPGMAGR